MVAVAGFGETLTFEQALDAAAKLNPDVQRAQLRILESQAGTDALRAGFRPQVTGQLGMARQTSNLQGIGLVFPGLPSRIGPYRTFDARPVVSQKVLDLSLLAGVRASRARVDQSKHEVAALREDIVLAAAQLYLQARQLESSAQAAEARIKTAGAILERAQHSEASGSASKLDVARAESQLYTERAGLHGIVKDLETAKSLLLRTIGRSQASVTLADVTAPVEPSSPAARAETAALEAKQRVAELEVQQARSKRMPEISASAGWGVLGAGPDRAVGTYSYGFTATVPVWTGGRIADEVKSAQSRVAQVEQELRGTRLRVEQEWQQSQIELTAAKSMLAEASKSLTAAQTVLELSRMRFASGLSTSLDVVTAQGTLAQAEDYQIRMRYEVSLAAVRLRHAAGVLTSN